MSSDTNGSGVGLPYVRDLLDADRDLSQPRPPAPGNLLCWPPGPRGGILNPPHLSQVLDAGQESHGGS